MVEKKTDNIETFWLGNGTGVISDLLVYIIKIFNQRHAFKLWSILWCKWNYSNTAK